LDEERDAEDGNCGGVGKINDGGGGEKERTVSEREQI
jgi:hypothetical protein